ncbi:MAG: hypothetical protein H0X30_07160 [Anaerolineae bacterium]|nr:hypothetical protein [Anaerolineae bacterium]
MPRKQKFIVNRHTWFLDQFEFSAACSYQESLVRLRTLEAELQAHYDKYAGGKGPRPILKLEPDDDASSFELVLENAIVTGTMQKITDETTLIVGLSGMSASFYFIAIMLVIFTLVLTIFPFLSAYVMADPNGIWSADSVNTALLGIKFILVFALLFYLMFRWSAWRAVYTLISAVDYWAYE